MNEDKIQGQELESGKQVHKSKYRNLLVCKGCGGPIITKYDNGKRKLRARIVILDENDKTVSFKCKWCSRENKYNYKEFPKGKFIALSLLDAVWEEVEIKE